MFDEKLYTNYDEFVKFYTNVFEAFFLTMHDEEKSYLTGAKALPNAPKGSDFSQLILQIFSNCLAKKKKELMLKEAEKKMREKREADAREAAKVKETQRLKDEQAIKDLITKYNKNYTTNCELFTPLSEEEAKKMVNNFDDLLKELFDIAKNY